MKKILGLTIGLALFLGVTGIVSANEYHGIQDPQGVPLYVLIEVQWDGVSPNGDWTVWGPLWDPEVGDELLTSCTDCLEMNYDFEFIGNTLHFDETMVDTVEATPQTRHVVLHDNDGDGTYTGSLTAEHYFPWVEGSANLYFDRLDYEVTTVDGEVTNFYYLQYEHKKL